MGFLDRVFRPRGEGVSPADAAAADPIIDRVIAKTDKRLAHVKDLRATLRGPVVAARARLAEAIARIPGPTEVSPRSWAQDATVRALFARADDAAAAFGEDEAVREFFLAHPASECVGMLGLEQVERRVIAAALYGDSVQAEVARTTLSFTRPQVLAPALDEAAVRDELLMRAFEYLALRAFERVIALRGEKRELEREVALLRSQVKLAERRGAGFGAVGADAPGPAVDRALLDRELARSVAELEQATTRDLLPLLVDEIAAVLADPGPYLAIEPFALALDSMNFVVPPSPEATALRVATLRLGNRGPYAVVIARFPRTELRAPENRMADAAKYL